MAFRRSDLQEAFLVPGTHAFRVLGYATADELEDVLGPGYFATASGSLRPGDLIYVNTRARPKRELPGAAGTAVRLALLMVRNGARGSVTVRLVQDFGRSDDPDPAEPAAPALPVATPTPAPPKGGRGRPPGSRNRKNGALAATVLN
jgi:hypothetical protein